LPLIASLIFPMMGVQVTLPQMMGVQVIAIDCR